MDWWQAMSLEWEGVRMDISLRGAYSRHVLWFTWNMDGYLCQVQLCSAILTSLLDTSVCEQVMALDCCRCHWSSERTAMKGLVAYSTEASCSHIGPLDSEIWNGCTQLIAVHTSKSWVTCSRIWEPAPDTVWLNWNRVASLCMHCIKGLMRSAYTLTAYTCLEACAADYGSTCRSVTSGGSLCVLW